MKIDLHCHTKATKSGDSPKRNISALDFKKKINEVSVKIVGITNHNEFDIQQYKEFYKIVQNDFMIWPGIELDVVGLNKEQGHVVIVSNPRDVDEFDNHTKEIINGVLPNDFSCSLDELIEFINNIDCIVMPHFLKPKSLDEDSILYIKKNMTNNYRLLYEPSNFRSLGILINHDYSSIVGSDIKDWDKYHENDFSNLKIDVDSYDQFMFLVKKDVSLIETLLQKQFKTKIDISYLRDNTELIEFYDDINVLFGSKGTGKSEALNRVKDFYTSKGKDIGYYEPKNTQDRIDEKLNVDINERNLVRYDKDDLSDTFTYITNWKDETVTQFKDYFNYVASRNKNQNKERMKILEITNISNSYIALFDKENTTQLLVLDISEKIRSIDLDSYLNAKEIKDLNIIIEKMLLGVMNRKKIFWMNREAVKLSNYTVESLKSIVEKNTELKTKPGATGLFEFLHNRIEMKCALKKIITAFEYSFEDKLVNVGKLEEGKVLQLRTSIRMLNVNSRAKEFDFKISALKSIKDGIQDSYSSVMSIYFPSKIAELIESLDTNNIKSMNPFVGIEKRFEINGENYRPSTGEATMIILDEVLKEEHDVYILDEPEKSLGNAYVNDVLVPRINDLSKLKKTVVIVTHNANVAVRTFPFRSILKEYKDGEYKTYVGNPFTNRLINIADVNDTKKWKDESIKILEGGREAFEERGEIYGE